ncbi:Receptor-like kinase tmk4 [Stylosanthes scabra]|uniref:Receptor-like kinase tmk4 n=1 Tax=Stylosanthes scabra TaxID=79078 RepID=A0ABU6QUX4_9FABA|nr:Receptor-like kinase tmk4 [Stylosanthes scabra]
MSNFLKSLTGAPSDWSTTTSHCKWSGITCDSSNSVTSIKLSKNSVSGALPSDLNTLTQLTTLSLASNALTGALPSLANLTMLQNVVLDQNNFTSVTKGAFSGLTSLQNLWLNNQNDGAGFTGTVDVLASMTHLNQVWLQKNQFTGPIPDLSNCTGLFDLQLRDNQLTGVLPVALTTMSSLKNISLDNNRLQGPTPAFKGVTVTLTGLNRFCAKAGESCDDRVNTLLAVAAGFGYPYRLADSWDGDNPCNDWTSVVCASGKIVTLNFKNLDLNGTISPAFANLTDLRNLYLNGNNLTGTIPDSLTSLAQLEVLDVSNNNLTGKIPSFPSKVKFSYGGNALLGVSGGGGGSGNSSSSSSGDAPSGSPSKASNGTSLSPGLIAGIAIISMFFVAVVLFVFCKCYAKNRSRKFGRVSNPETGKGEVKIDTVNTSNANGFGGGGGAASGLQSQGSEPSEQLPVFEGGNVTISIQVLRQVTNNFSEDNILGRGGFGVVYKGELHDGTKIAVKRMESVAMGTKGMNEFQAEIAVLSKVRHRHLVALLGYCMNGNERLLVYEYMPQGTLTQHLFDWNENGCAPLTWKQRVAIALDVARGVEYLHSLAQQSFIHRDLKPSNILLGDDMRAKVADFGLVKNAPDGKYSVETRLAGTFGYLAPEYAATGRVTTKVDVYAFGVVLMELITGRRALDDTVPDDRSHLVSWFRRIQINKENIPKAIDQTLDPDEETMESIYKVAELAGHCTAREPYQRPDMGHAVNVLVPLVEQWKPTNHEEEEGYGIDLHMSLPQALRRWQANEGTSTMFNDMSFSSQTQSSIPAKPSGFADSFHSMDCR